ncbi:MAG: PGPGW domain-containing protein [Planctomycetaceae bacterium]
MPSLSLAIRLAIWLRKGVIFVLGLSVVVVGVVMLVTPGPAFVVIPAGLAILATEFYWARRLLQDVRRRIEERVRQTLGGPTPPGDSSAPSPTPSTDR